MGIVDKFDLVDNLYASACMLERYKTTIPDQLCFTHSADNLRGILYLSLHSSLYARVGLAGDRCAGGNSGKPLCHSFGDSCIGASSEISRNRFNYFVGIVGDLPSYPSFCVGNQSDTYACVCWCWRHMLRHIYFD